MLALVVLAVELVDERVMSLPMSLVMSLSMSSSTLSIWIQRPTNCCRLIRQAGLPLEVPQTLTKEDLIRGLQTDKKVVDGKVRFVCLEEIGKTRFMHMSVQELVHSL